MYSPAACLKRCAFFYILVRLESLRNLRLSITQKVAEGVGEASPLMRMICRSNFVWLASFLLATKTMGSSGKITSFKTRQNKHINSFIDSVWS